MRLFLGFLLGTVVYYCILFYVFLSSREKRWDASEGQPIEVRWDKNTAFVDSYIPFFAFPLLVMIIWRYGLWLLNTRTRGGRIGIFLSMIPIGLGYLLFMFFISMLGYQP